MVKFAKNTCISKVVLLLNLVKSWRYKYIAICSTVSMLSTKIIIFRIAHVGVVGVKSWLSFWNPVFMIWAIKYIIFVQSNHSWYNWARAQNYKYLQIYFNIFGITVVNSISISTLKNMSFKWPIIQYFFSKGLLTPNQMSFVNDYIRQLLVKSVDLISHNP